MINDFEVDMEELESRLYSQVYHSNTNDNETHTNIQNSSEKVNLYRQNLRYFQTKSFTKPSYTESDYISVNDKNAGNSKYAASWKTKIQASDFFNVNTNIVKNVPVQLNSNISQIVDVINPHNNIVLPQIPSQIVTPVDYFQSSEMNTNLEKYVDRQARRQQKKQKKTERFKQRRNEIKKLLKEQRQAKDLTLTGNAPDTGFTVHYLNETGVSSKHNKESNIVTLSDSDDSCVEIPEKRDLVVLSSDESDINQENDTNINELKIKESIETYEQSPLLETKDSLNKETNCADSVFSDDDDVLLIDDIPKNLEIIDLDCDLKSVTVAGCSKISSSKSIESDSTNSDLRKLHSIETCRSSIKHRIVIGERNELLKTPDSTSNDFLDCSLDLQQKRFNFSLHGSDFGNNRTFIKPKSHVDIYETESSCSTSDNSTPIKNSVFHEVEFETPNKELFSELNLEAFGDYITPNRDNRPDSELAENEVKQVTTKSSRRNGNQLSNINSDSSSESDYESDKIHLSKAKRKLPDLTSVGQHTTSNSSKEKENLSSEFMPLKKIKSSNAEFIPNKSLELAQVNKHSAVNSNVLEISDSSEVHCISDEEDTTSSTKNDIHLVNCKTLMPITNRGQIFKRLENFSKYWTTDMNKFYNTSWGLESFSVEKIQETMLDDPKLWKIIDEDRRYINLSFPRGPRCHRCRELGHMALHCPNNKRVATCSLCGQIGHYDARCPNALCTLCGSPGGYGTYCSSCSDWKYRQCNICSMYGHIDRKCPDLWRRYHLTTRAGPIVKPLKPSYKRIEDRWCSGCAKSGHYEYKCRLSTRSHHSVDPYVKEYHDIYNFPKTHQFLIHCNNTPVRNTEFDKRANNNHAAVSNVPTEYSSSISVEKDTNTINKMQEMHNYEKLNIQGVNTDISFRDFVFPPVEMIPPYFREHVTIIENRLKNKCIDNINLAPNSANIERVCIPGQSEVVHNTSLNPEVHTSTYSLNYKLFAFLHSSKGIEFIKCIQQQPNISIIINQNEDESRGMIEICGNLEKVKSVANELENFFKYVPKLNDMPKFSKAVYSFLSPRLDKIERIVGNCKSLYNNMSKLELQLTSTRDTSQIKKKIKEAKLHLNMLLFGKLRLGDGHKHMDNLQYWQKQFEEKENYKIPLNILYDLYDSYSFIFLDRINHNYKFFCGIQTNNNRYIRNPSKDKELVIRYYKLVEKKCRKLNMLNKLHQLNHLRSAIYQPMFSVKAFKEFMTYCHKFLHFAKTQVS